MGRIDLPSRPRILVIALRRLGDVLLTTPLIASLRRAWPDAVIDALVFADTAGILNGNPDINNVVSFPGKRTLSQSLQLAARLYRRYDLAISTQSGDRPTFFAFVAGRRRVALVQQTLKSQTIEKMLDRSLVYVAGVHRVEEMLRLADVLGIERVPQLVSPSARSSDLVPQGDYAVIHAAPMFRYKQWTAQGWRDLAAVLASRGMTVAATGGPGAEERAYLDQVWQGASVTRLDGKLDWAQLSGLLANAKVFIGPDTSVTHLAAAAGAPTVALFGPTDPRLWGPFPAGGLNPGWSDTGQIQQRRNVTVVQNTLPCTPCQLEGCERRLESYSACLDQLTSGQVIAAVDQALRWKR